MPRAPRRTRGKQQGPRSQRVVDSVREATLNELARVGYGQLSMDRVASEAGVHRTTVYRRWPTKEALVASLLEPGLERLRSVPHGEDLRSDLEALALRFAADLSDPTGRALAAVLASPVPELQAMSQAAGAQTHAAFTAAFARAVERGEIPAATPVDTRVHLLFYGVVHHALDHGGPIDADSVREMVGLILP